MRTILTSMQRSKSFFQKMRVRERAYAKINLYLDVRGKRADGFHELSTVMQTVSLYDDILLTVEATSPEVSSNRAISDVAGGVSFFSNVPFLPTDERNLAVRAALSYMRRASLYAKVRIDMRKVIPTSAGLAGGSADAAAVLRGMNRLFSGMLSRDDLLSLAAELGSDVSFCLLGGARLCRGRGEVMRKLTVQAPLYTVIAIDRGEGVSTPAAFAALDEMYANFDGSVPFRMSADEEIIAAFAAVAPDFRACLYNAFEAAILPKCPSAVRIKEQMDEAGAIATMMSGSGPSVFGIFDSEASARRVAAHLNGDNRIRAFFATATPSLFD